MPNTPHPSEPHPNQSSSALSLRVLHPCTRSWTSLAPVAGDKTRRYCDDCSLHVHNELGRVKANDPPQRVYPGMMPRPEQPAQPPQTPVPPPPPTAPNDPPEPD